MHRALHLIRSWWISPMGRGRSGSWMYQAARWVAGGVPFACVGDMVHRLCTGPRSWLDLGCAVGGGPVPALARSDCMWSRAPIRHERMAPVGFFLFTCCLFTCCVQVCSSCTVYKSFRHGHWVITCCVQVPVIKVPGDGGLVMPDSDNIVVYLASWFHWAVMREDAWAVWWYFQREWSSVAPTPSIHACSLL